MNGTPLWVVGVKLALCACGGQRRDGAALCEVGGGTGTLNFIFENKNWV